MVESRGILFRAGLFFTLALCLAAPAPSAHAIEEHVKIQGLFNTARDVVIKCIGCHQQKAEEVLQSTHWTWKSSRTVNGRQVLYGKMDSLTGFAVDVASNPSRCLRCHISTNPVAGIIDQGGAADVDCLVCHDTSGRYRRGELLEQADYEIIARSAGKPGPANCATCHFSDCGLMEYSRPDSRKMRKQHAARGDVHMDGQAAPLACQGCHVLDSGHTFSRVVDYAQTVNVPGAECVSCHTVSPHTIERLNLHTVTVSCRACHIPEYAVRTPAMIGWNWFLTGRIMPVHQSVAETSTFLQDGNGFTSSMLIRPVYMWDDGGDQVYTRGQRIQPQELTFLKRPSPRAPRSKIAPFRLLYGTQLYDAKYRYLISPLLSSAGEELFPGSDWDAIAREGMNAIVLPYSGEYGVAPTAAFRRLNHGVAPAEKALDCTDCHGGSTRLDWSALGYDEDPWSREQAGRAAAEPLKEEEVSGERENSAPGRELQVPPVPGF